MRVSLAQVPSTASASSLVTGNSLPDRAAHFSFRQLEWLEVCSWFFHHQVERLPLPYDSFFGGVNYSNSFMFSVLPLKLLRLYQGVSI